MNASLTAEPARSAAPELRTSAWVGAYLWVIALLLPIDWFSPTGLLFREFGAKPASLVLTLGGLYGMAFCRAPRGAGGRTERAAGLIAAALLALGTAAFSINLIVGWSSDGYARSPLMQFLNQSLLLATALVAVLGNARLAWCHGAAVRLGRILPWAAALHLLVFTLQALSAIDHFSPWLLLFRSDDGLIERPTGLMSEPSYYGVCAALYGAILLTLPARGLRRTLHVLLTLALYGTAMAINAKTMVIVAGSQIVLGILFPTGRRVSMGKALLMLAVISAVGYSFVTRFSTLDVSENLSSAMRFGSTLLAVNAGGDGYALTGIGTGQFHFFYRDAFAPDFLYLTGEGLDQLSRDAANRASTFNLYVRLALETGLLGLLLFVGAMLALLRTQLEPPVRYVSTLLAGALGFLMTQDTYFYPPLVLSCALLLALRYRAAATRSARIGSSSTL